MGSRGVHGACIVQGVFARNFNKAAVPALGTAPGADAAFVVCVVVGPNNDFAAIACAALARAVLVSVGMDGGLCAHAGVGGVVHIGVAPLVVAAHQHRAALAAAARVGTGVDAACPQNLHGFAQHLHPPARAVCVFGHQAGTL